MFRIPCGSDIYRSTEAMHSTPRREDSFHEPQRLFSSSTVIGSRAPHQAGGEGGQSGRHSRYSYSCAPVLLAPSHRVASACGPHGARLTTTLPPRREPGPVPGPIARHPPVSRGGAPVAVLCTSSLQILVLVGQRCRLGVLELLLVLGRNLEGAGEGKGDGVVNPERRGLGESWRGRAGGARACGGGATSARCPGASRGA